MRRPVVALLALILLVTLANVYGNLHDSSRINGVVSRLKGDEAATKHTAEHTRVVQVQGGPVAVCLLKVMENVAPLLLKVPSVEQPLDAYVRLQSKRYPGVKCPDKP
jgi:hypothetical protein